MLVGSTWWLARLLTQSLPHDPQAWTSLWSETHADPHELRPASQVFASSTPPSPASPASWPPSTVASDAASPASDSSTGESVVASAPTEWSVLPRIALHPARLPAKSAIASALSIVR
jgi:hypothetical protein